MVEAFRKRCIDYMSIKNSNGHSPSVESAFLFGQIIYVKFQNFTEKGQKRIWSNEKLTSS